MTPPTLTEEQKIEAAFRKGYLKASETLAKLEAAAYRKGYLKAQGEMLAKFEEISLKLMVAATEPDWHQVILNGGPPCFHVSEDGTFCFRAQRWVGHGEGDHRFVSLLDLISNEITTNLNLGIRPSQLP